MSTSSYGPEHQPLVDALLKVVESSRGKLSSSDIAGCVMIVAIKLIAKEDISEDQLLGTARQAFRAEREHRTDLPRIIMPS